MPTVLIDGKPVQAREGERLINVIRLAGIEVPTLCHMADRLAWTACMVCVVYDRDKGALVPSCSASVDGDMTIETDSDLVREARRTVIELLLSEHVGDCEAPCRRACPRHLDIPRMLRMAKAGTPLPARAPPCVDCAARCERACRRGRIDEAVAIRAVLLGAARAPEPVVREDPGFERTSCECISKMGRIRTEEIPALMLEADPGSRMVPLAGESAGVTPEEAGREAGRCMRCDCRAALDCRLRELAVSYAARQSRYRPDDRPLFRKVVGATNIVYEAGKCVRCGACVRITEAAGEHTGMALIDRGTDMRIAPALDVPLEEAMAGVAGECVAACPSGALAYKE